MHAINPNQQASIDNRIAFSCLLCAVSLLFVSPAAATASQSHGDVKLAWDPNSETDIAAYVIHLGTASGEYSQVLDVGNVTEHALTGLTSGTTYYCALQAFNTEGFASELSNEVSFVIPVAGSDYDQWASSGGLSGPDADLSATPFADGVSNLLKFAFNMNPSGPDNRVMDKETGTSGLPKIGLEKVGADTWFTVEFVRRKNVAMVYAPKVSTDLRSFHPMAGSEFVTDIDAQWERVLVSMPCAPSITPALFGRVEVTRP